METELTERIRRYWTIRSGDFARLRADELENEQGKRWLCEIEKYLPEGKALRILDVGTGCGFFSILLALAGHQTTGIDLTEAMIEEARRLSREMRAESEFYVMDAQKLLFETGSFDVVISRNLTWTLPQPERAYAEWLRVLKPGGMLLNFDADYGRENFSKEVEKLPQEHVHHDVSKSCLAECDAIREALPISRERRPEWDEAVLKELGCREILTDSEVSKRIYREKDRFYNPTPMFAICGKK